MVNTERRWTGLSVDDVLSVFGSTAVRHAGDAGHPTPADVIVFGGGIPDSTVLPAGELLAAAGRAMADTSYALRYGPAQGDLMLREWLADRLNAQEDAGVGPEHFFLTSGSGQAIQMTVSAFLNPGDSLLVELPSYSGALRTFRAYGVEPIGVPMDDDGVLPGRLEATIERLTTEGRVPKLFYTMASLHNPTGITTPVSRREAVVDICDRHRVLIVEDDAYGEIRVEGVRPPSYIKVSGGEGALRLSTFSKMLATGLRVGWITGRADFIDAFTRMRFDGALSPFLLRTVAEFCVSGEEDRHLERMLPLYREKRDRMLSALAERCSNSAIWTHPEGGFFIWLKVADEIDPAKLTETMKAERVLARPGTQFFPDGTGQNYLRLCFSELAPDVIEEGIRRLARALDAAR